MAPSQRLRSHIDARLLHALLALPPGVCRRLAGPPRVVDGAPLQVDVQLMLRLQRVARLSEIGALPLARAREVIVEQSAMVGGQPDIGEVRDLEVPGATGPLAARLYTPFTCVDRDELPTLLFFHGGGWICTASPTSSTASST